MKCPLQDMNVLNKIVSRASHTASATEVIVFLSMTKKFCPRPNFCNAFLQAGLTDLDEIWHDGVS